MQDRPKPKKSPKLRHEVFNGLSVLSFNDGQFYLDQVINKIKEGFEAQSIPEETKQEVSGKESYVMIDELNIKEV
jgi:hypothetical protein